MAEGKMNKLWGAVIVFLVAAIIVGGVIINERLSPAQPVEISLPDATKATLKETPGLERIFISGGVVAPGLYQLKSGDTIPGLIRSAGGVIQNADTSVIELSISIAGSANSSQKIDINRADTWLLEALPEIGETLAQRIVDYRRKSGPFRSIDELLKVPGIGDSVYDKIKNLITVADL